MPVREASGSRWYTILPLILALWACLTAYELGLESESFSSYTPLWMVLVCLPVAVFLQNKIIKILRYEGDSPVGRDMRRSKGFAIGAFIVYAGDVLGSVVAGELSYDPGIIAIFFLYLCLLLVLRAGMRIISFRLRRHVWGGEAWRRSAGYSDSVLLGLHAVVLALCSSVPVYRGVVIVLVAAALRLAWGYVPEDRLIILREFIQFLNERKLWWMAPIFIVLAFLMVLVLLTQSTGGGFPFIYAVF